VNDASLLGGKELIPDWIELLQRFTHFGLLDVAHQLPRHAPGAHDNLGRPQHAAQLVDDRGFDLGGGYAADRAGLGTELSPRPQPVNRPALQHLPILALQHIPALQHLCVRWGMGWGDGWVWVWVWVWVSCAGWELLNTLPLLPFIVRFPHDLSKLYFGCLQYPIIKSTSLCLTIRNATI
jgi:hypothetical protein